MGKYYLLPLLPASFFVECLSPRFHLIIFLPRPRGLRPFPASPRSGSSEEANPFPLGLFFFLQPPNQVATPPVVPFSYCSVQDFGSLPPGRGRKEVFLLLSSRRLVSYHHRITLVRLRHFLGSDLPSPPYPRGATKLHSPGLFLPQELLLFFSLFEADWLQVVFFLPAPHDLLRSVPHPPFFL